MPETTFLMGLKITKRDKSFVYIVMPMAVGEAVVEPRMPLVVSADKRPVEFSTGIEGPIVEQQKLF